MRKKDGGMIQTSTRTRRGPKVVAITRRLQPKGDERPSTNQISTEYDIYCNAPERSKMEIVESEIRADMRNSLKNHEVLGKARYVIENAETAFEDQNQRIELVLRMIKIIREYAEPEGSQILLITLERYKEEIDIRKLISSALANIGTEEHLGVLINLVSLADTDQLQHHLVDLQEFLARHPECIAKAKEDLERLSDGLERTEPQKSVIITAISCMLQI